MQPTIEMTVIKYAYMSTMQAAAGKLDLLRSLVDFYNDERPEEQKMTHVIVKAIVAVTVNNEGTQKTFSLSNVKIDPKSPDYGIYISGSNTYSTVSIKMPCDHVGNIDNTGTYIVGSGDDLFEIPFYCLYEIASMDDTTLISLDELTDVSTTYDINEDRLLKSFSAIHAVSERTKRQIKLN